MKLSRVDVSAYSNNAIRKEDGRFYMAHEVDAEIDALKAKIAGGSPREVITLKTELQLMVEQRETLWKEIDALKAENERLRTKYRGDFMQP